MRPQNWELTHDHRSSPSYSCFHRNAPKWKEIRFVQRQKQTFQVQNWQTGSHQGFWRGCSPGRMGILSRENSGSWSLGSVRCPCPITDSHSFDFAARAWGRHPDSVLGFVPPPLPSHCQHDSFKSLGALIPSTTLQACSELASEACELPAVWDRGSRRVEGWGGQGVFVFVFVF